MAHLNFHPAPGFGDLLPGFFVVPQNPIRGASTPMVPSVQAAAGGQVVRVPHVGDLLPGQFPVPQNPIRAAMGGLGAYQFNNGLYGPDGVLYRRRLWPADRHTISGLGCGCGCSDGCGCGGTNPSGLQGISDSVAAWVTAPSPVSSISNFVFYGGLAAAGAYFMFFRHHRR